ncbi:MAG TPA: glutamine synthetase family protein [Ktedonobacteraceae bacterium]|jgi:glutamine synthetase|nr:glutamine synthetase family protein [Ktedonobacteraceae bacterium]
MAEEKEQAKREFILAAVEAEGVGFVNLEFTDVVGMAKCVTIPVEQLPDCLMYGKWFDGSAIEGFARVAESDMYLFPDLDTFTILPGRIRPHEIIPSSQFESDDRFLEAGAVARIICDVYTPNGERFDGDPRATLTQALDLANSMDFNFLVAPELEFFLLHLEDKTPMPLPHDRGGYFDLSTDLAATVRRQMVQALQQMGIRIEASHHEVAAGQHELDFETADALKIADGLMTAKYVLKGIAAQHDLYATFLPKPFFGVNGSGMHTHQQLISKATGQNVFVDENGEYGLSDTGRYFIAGQLAHAHAMCAILAPLVNSYKRLVPGFEAPVYIKWGRVNREALIRVPRPGIDRQHSARIELRCPDPSSNPYLALAVMLRSGLDGIQRKLPLPPAMDESLFLRDDGESQRHRTRLLPATLGEALEGLREDNLIRETLGDSIYEGFIEAKSIEWMEYRKQVHAWELERYLPVF